MRYGARSDGLWLLATLLALLAWDAAGLDLFLVRLFGTEHGFPWREHWLTARVLHEGGRALGLAVLGALVVGIWRPLPFARDLDRAERIWWVGIAAACALFVLLLKHLSLTSCPWSLSEFGGHAHYVSHWAFGVADGGEGGCFPSGHASSGFALIGGWFVLREHHPRAARIWLAAVVVFGLVMGWAQMMRGAHYASHTLWTGWICFALAAGAWHAFAWFRRGRPARRVGAA
jgi:membrane-associated PAP2 superfamily phosphatase